MKTLLEPGWRGCYRAFLKANGIGSLRDVDAREEK